MKNIIKSLKLKRRGIAMLAGMHFFGNPSVKLKIVGVTGTNGKTTTATLLYKITIALGHKAGLISTVENIINGEVLTVLEDRPIPGTTPDPITLYRLFNKMMEKGCEYVFMEVSSHALDQGRVAGINFTGGIFTNLTHDHLDYHQNFDNYFGAKKKFFNMLNEKAFALSNTDNEYGIKMLEAIKARKFFYGFQDFPEVRLRGNSPKSDFGEESSYFFGEIKKLDFSGLELEINKEKVKTNLLGKFNAYNLLAVWSACVLLGFDKEKVKEQLKNVLPPKGRFDYFKNISGVMVIVDYAHTPDALQNVLKTVQGIKTYSTSSGRVISVFGCGGDRDPLKRPLMGKLGARLSDIAIFTSDNPRSEDPDKIIEQMKINLSSEDLKKVKIIPNRREAILEAIKIAQKGDIVLCAGKGHEDYQEIKGVKHHFDDMEEFRKAFI
ncbi:UDP-N-acetylmuramoyl-L-alanyl-D-glutamate--2,6-diaminopimelate ligase [Patescibacteria group bacterium]|nr:UDP-N-acetylmuramoyl-L-alanyl-D-glutamate--2,6-diaminopimelate ligase [Patescibacteria group bacterium]